MLSRRIIVDLGMFRYHLEEFGNMDGRRLMQRNTLTL